MQTGALKPLTAVVTAMVGIQALYLPAVMTGVTFSPEFIQTSIAPIINELDAGYFVFKILTMILFSVWIYVAGRNLVSAGFDDLEYSPGSRIWWFAVPIANLFKPYQGMRELWNASHGAEHNDEGNALLGWWWALWLAAGIFSQIVARIDNPVPQGLLWIECLAGLASAVTAILLVRGVARAQEGLSEAGLAEVFA